MHPVIEWKDDCVYMLDQRKLPSKEIILKLQSYQQVAQCIKKMAIRGAPAIGVAAAMGIALGVVKNKKNCLQQFPKIIEAFANTRPTAVNLFWAINRMKKVFESNKHNIYKLSEELVKEALSIDREDVEINKQIGLHGSQLLKSGYRVLTHCNAGALATAGFGTALGIIRRAIADGKKIDVFAGETRPYLQGARLTVWELQRDKIPVTLITDNMAGYVMAKGLIDAIIVGADRIAANGDTANKIGTYSLALLAKYHHLPFYVAAPLSTFDFTKENGQQIPIEERPKEEVIYFMRQPIARSDTSVLNPAFDITPNHLISAIVTEKKVLYPDYKISIKSLVDI